MIGGGGVVHKGIFEVDDVISHSLEFLPDIVNDLDVDFSSDPRAAAAYVNDQRNLRKIREHTAKLSVNVMAPTREGKRLLVLDIDYSIKHFVKNWHPDH